MVVPGLCRESHGVGRERKAQWIPQMLLDCQIGCFYLKINSSFLTSLANAATMNTCRIGFSYMSLRLVDLLNDSSISNIPVIYQKSLHFRNIVQ